MTAGSTRRPELPASARSARPAAPERHVVLVAPEIHWNTGNIGRTCLAAGAQLHLVRPLGFSLAGREVKRAGLDYWDEVAPQVWDNFAAWTDAMQPQPGEIALLTKRGDRPFWAMPRPPRLCLIFGSETRGLPEALLARWPGSTFHIPITGRTRSLNLSTATGIALYESLREAPAFHAWSNS